MIEYALILRRVSGRIHGILREPETIQLPVTLRRSLTDCVKAFDECIADLEALASTAAATAIAAAVTTAAAAITASAAGVTAASRTGNRDSRGGLDALFLEKIVQFLRFQDGEREKFVAEFSYISHFFNSLSCSVCQFVSGE